MIELAAALPLIVLQAPLRLSAFGHRLTERVAMRKLTSQSGQRPRGQRLWQSSSASWLMGELPRRQS